MVTGLCKRSLVLRPAGWSPSLGCVRPHLSVKPSRTLVGPLRHRQLPDGLGTQTTWVNRDIPKTGSFHPVRTAASASHNRCHIPSMAEYTVMVMVSSASCASISGTEAVVVRLRLRNALFRDESQQAELFQTVIEFALCHVRVRFADLG
jgi:hypothetical protein